MNVHGDAVVVASIILSIVITVSIILRFLARMKTRAGIGADDWTIMASLIPAYVMIILSVLCLSASFASIEDIPLTLLIAVVTKGGAGRKHKAELRPSQVTILLKACLYSLSISPNVLVPSLLILCFQIHMQALVTYGLTITLVKISILLLYRRIFNSPAFKQATLVVGALCIAWSLADVFTALFQCSPVSAAWNQALLVSSQCKDIKKIMMGITISNMFIDFIILCMPLPVVWKLQLSTRKKLGVCFIFVLGGL